MLACAWGTGTVTTRLSREGLVRLGCAPADLMSRRAWCAVTAVPFTWGGLSFLGLLPLVAVGVGLCEGVFGPWRTAGVFLATDVGAGLIEGVTFQALSPLLGGQFATRLLTAPDVGPSAGCFGCLGALVACLSPRGRALGAIGLGVFMAGISFWRPDPGFATTTLWVSDLAHPAAAAVGYGWARLAVIRRAERSQDVAPDGSERTG
jgi:hypothetical protein